jgi:hypothetical protein
MIKSVVLANLFFLASLFIFRNDVAAFKVVERTEKVISRDTLPQSTGCSKEKKCCVRRKRCQEKAAMQDSAKAAGCEKKSSGCCRSKKAAKCCKSKS